MEVVGGKWKLVIVDQLLMHTVMRFSELRRAMPGVTQKMLTAQLRELERAQVVERTVYPVVPPKVEYRLTARGVALKPSLDAMRAWGAAYIQPLSPSR